MRRSTLICLTAVLVLAGSMTPARAYDILNNGSFETGDFTGWQLYEVSGGGGAGWSVRHASEGESPINGVPLDPPALGAFQAITDNEVGCRLILHREIAIPATTRATLSLRLWIRNPYGYSDSGDFFWELPYPNQKIFIDVQQPDWYPEVQWMSLQTVYVSGPSTPGYLPSTLITSDLSAYAGQTVRLRIAMVSNLGPLVAGVDDVRLDVAPFTPIFTNLEPMNHGAAAWGDYDGDDDLDLVIGGATLDVNLNVLYRQDVGGVLSYSGIPLPLESQNGYAWGDYDNDGDLDLLTLGYAGGPVTQLWRNEGGASLTPVPDSFADVADGAAAWGDFDNDGDLDLALTGMIDGWGTTGVIYRNFGGGSFAYANEFEGVRQGSVQWGDFDLDGDLDLLACGHWTNISSSNRVTRVHIGDGTGFFTTHDLSFIPLLDDGMARWADFNGDGLLDVAIAGNTDTGPIARVYLCDPWIHAYANYTDLTAVVGASLDCGDFDNDGDTDVVIAGFDGTQRITRVYQNDGTGLSFADAVAGLPGARDGAVQWADFDRDGDLDLLVSGDGASGLFTHLYRNTTPVSNTAPGEPSGVAAQLVDEGVRFYWGPGSDDHTASLTGNLRIGSTTQGAEEVTPHANPSSGFRRVVQPGNIGSDWSRFIRFTGLGHGVLRWAIQQVDGAFLGGPFSTEQTLSLGGDLLSIQDVPGDQGGRVRLSIGPSPLDDEYREAYPVSGYNVWRRVLAGGVAAAVAREGTRIEAADATQRLRGNAPAAAGAGRRIADAAGAATAVAAASAAADLPLVEWNGRTFARGGEPGPAAAFPPGTWELVASFFSQQQPQYLVNVPTEADSGAGGENWAVFVVTAHTTVPSVWFAGEPDSGKSVDNLAPGAPQDLVAEYHTGSGNTLTWQPAPETDFASFRVYRGTSASFVASPDNFVASVPAPSFVDPSYDDATVFYKVSTTDHAGNESPAVPPGQTVAVGDAVVPLAFALRVPAPNPFGVATRVAFALPAPERVRLRVFDAAGRLVRTLAHGAFPAGEHAVTWRGDHDSGGLARAGVYFVRIEAGPHQATRRVLRVE